MAIETDPMFVGMTRPAMVKGVPYDAMIVNGLLSAVVFLAMNNILYLAICFPIHGIFYAMCLKEPRIFELLKLWLMTKGKNLMLSYWKASSYSPLPPFRVEADRPKLRGKK